MLFLNKKKNLPEIGNEGFTFIEIIIALSVFSIGVLGVTVMQTTAVQSNNTAMRTSKAVAYASDQMEKILAEDFNSLTDGTSTDGTYTVAWTIDPEIDNKRKVHVTVAWSNKGYSQSLNFDMIRNEKI